MAGDGWQLAAGCFNWGAYEGAPADGFGVAASGLQGQPRRPRWFMVASSGQPPRRYAQQYLPPKVRCWFPARSSSLKDPRLDIVVVTSCRVRGERTDFMAQDVCAHCGSSDFHRGIPIAGFVNAGRGDVSLSVKDWFRYHERLLCDLCKQCGTVNRLYVQNANRNWRLLTKQIGRRRLQTTKEKGTG
jgi:hypothetical protein